MKQAPKPYILYLVIIAIGLLIMAVAVPYYAFDWGVKPCTGALTDAANCGDADLGGMAFIMLGLPLAVLGILGAFVRWTVGLARRKK